MDKIVSLKNNQIVIEEDKKIIFYSYNSKIATIKNNNLILTHLWDYSITTKKYLYIFLDRYINNFSDILKDNIKELKKVSNKTVFIKNLIDKKILKLED